MNFPFNVGSPVTVFAYWIVSASRAPTLAMVEAHQVISVQSE